jgi:hypothetical protein
MRLALAPFANDLLNSCEILRGDHGYVATAMVLIAPRIANDASVVRICEYVIEKLGID